MITLAQVQQILTNAQRPDLLPHAPLLMQIANIYIGGDADFEEYVDVALRHVAGPHGNLPAGSVANTVRDRFIYCCENDWIFDNPVPCRTQAMALAVAGPPAPPPPPPAPNQYAEYVARLKRLRTQTARDHGRLLAVAAGRMDGWFHWVKSGPVSAADLQQAQAAGQVQRVGPLFGPREHWQQNQGLRRNDFALWVNGGAVPSPLAHMNCWEAVLFSAYRANLVTFPWLQTIHRKAAVVNQFIHRRTGGGEENYYRALSQALGFVDSVPFLPEAGLVPHPGDVLFWDQTEHIAIALGRRWVNGSPEDHIMSHWHNNGGTFSALTLEDLPNWAQTRFRFRPCPF
jgi:hypothetical protein